MTDRDSEAMLKQYAQIFKMIDDIVAAPKVRAVPPLKDTWLIRQLKTMRVDAQLAGLDHEATVLTAAIEELGGVL